MDLIAGGRNLQGDVIAILNAMGGTVVEYKYDAWGNILSVTGSMASTLGAVNPFRYRGYYYDAESGWYYLQSRYYDPQVGRFLNADGIIGANGGIMGYNMFAYCNNNPVIYADESGYEILDYRDYDSGTLEYEILFNWYLENCVYDVGFLGDIEVGTKDVSIQQFIKAMQNVNCQAPVALIHRYNSLVEPHMRVDQNGQLINKWAPEHRNEPSEVEKFFAEVAKNVAATVEYFSEPENTADFLEGLGDGMIALGTNYSSPGSGYVVVAGLFCRGLARLVRYLTEE